MKKFLSSAVLCLVTAVAAHAYEASAGAVFVATNDVNKNEVVMYARSATGVLKYVGTFETGGRGEGGINDPLQAQS